jgi:hypothetical protein
VNPDAIDFQAWKRRRDAAARCAPLDSGRRDPDGRPAFDPEGRAYRDAVAHLEEVLTLPTTPPAVAASIAVLLERGDAA